MRAACLLGVFLLAKVLILAGREVPLSFWTPIAYIWQDVLVALAFAALATAVRFPWLSWILYAITVFYVAWNVPLARVLSSPLTWPMVRAARGTLADSIKHHLTPHNLALPALVLTVGLLLPLLLKRVRRPVGDAVILAAFVIVALGPLAAARVETGGLHRNVLVPLIATAIPRLRTEYSAEDWRASPFENPRADDLSRYRGAAAGRNVVLVALESTGAQYLLPYGASEDPMPHLTRLAGRSILFENAYAVYPESIKGLFSVLCSRYPALDTDPEIYRHIRSRSLAEVLSAAGYHTALFHSGRFMYLGMEGIIRDRGFQTLEDAGAIGGNYNSSFGVEEASVVARILSWIDALPRDARFFVTYLPTAGHHPYSTPEPRPFPENDELGRYRNALHYGDWALGELFKGLRQRALDQHTLFVIYGDHGEAFGQHEGNFGHTLFLYEENIRVPYLILAPGIVAEQVRVKRVASLIDSLPTILDLLGLPVPDTCQGRSLLEAQSRVAPFYTDYSLGLLGLRDGCWKYIYELDSGRSKLYDLCQDPEEKRNLADGFPRQAEAYRKHVERWAAAQRDLVTRMK